MADFHLLSGVVISVAVLFILETVFVYGSFPFPSANNSSNSIDNDSDIIHKEFENFIRKYGKNYTTDEERSKRFKIFERTFNYIRDFNRTRGPDNFTFTLGINSIADLDTAELASCLGSAGKNVGNYSLRGKGKQKIVPRRPSDQEPSPSIDWRARGAVTSVKTQRCGDCWTFGVVAAVEGLVQIRTGELIELSVQELLDCVEGSNCKEGHPDAAYQRIYEYEITSEYFYHYDGYKHNYCADVFKPRKARIDQYDRIPTNDELSLTWKVSEQPVTVGICASDMEFQTYTGGVFTVECLEGVQIGHVAALVGYGTDIYGTPFWLLKNSWGMGWGEAGYMRMRRGVNFRGVARFAWYPIIHE